MRSYRGAAVVVGGLSALMGLFASEQSRCPEITAAERARLIAYVKAKYELPSALSLGVSEISFVGGTCYRNLRFETQGSGRAVKIELVASPDLRFLAREVLDSRLDPAEEKRQKAEALRSALNRGAFAVLGDGTAPVTITVFSDFQCPYCAQASDVLLKQILPAEADNARLIFRHFPLTTIHPWARSAAEAAACARQQGTRYFWLFHDYLFEHQREITPDTLNPMLTAYGGGLPGFDGSEWLACLDGKRGANEVADDLALGAELGVRGTPTIFVNGLRITGMQSEQIRTYIREVTRMPAR